MEIKITPKNKVLKLNKKNLICPTCKEKSKEPYTPFCSKKCSDIDLMKWLSDENYVILD